MGVCQMFKYAKDYNNEINSSIKTIDTKPTIRQRVEETRLHKIDIEKFT